MKNYLIKLVFIFICFTAFPGTGLSSDEGTVTGSPVAFLPSDTYNFDPVLEGNPVRHDFIIENKGNATLQIFSVKTSCGCTAASYSKEIAPGASGNISLSLNTKGYGGKSVNKTAHVETNDPDNMSITLTLSGQVEACAKIEPEKATLTGTTGDDIRTEIKIIPNSKSPFKITGVKANKGENISLDLKEIKGGDSLQYVLSVVNLRKTAGKYSDRIILTTDSEIKPQITISVSGDIK